MFSLAFCYLLPSADAVIPSCRHQLVDELLDILEARFIEDRVLSWEKCIATPSAQPAHIPQIPVALPGMDLPYLGFPGISYQLKLKVFRLGFHQVSPSLKILEMMSFLILKYLNQTVSKEMQGTNGDSFNPVFPGIVAKLKQLIDHLLNLSDGVFLQ